MDEKQVHLEICGKFFDEMKKEFSLQDDKLESSFEYKLNKDSCKISITKPKSGMWDVTADMTVDIKVVTPYKIECTTEDRAVLA